MASGVVARVHGNTGKRKKTGLSLNQIQEIIMNYAGVCRCVEREGERRGRGSEMGVCVCVSDGGGKGGGQRESVCEREITLVLICM